MDVSKTVFLIEDDDRVREAIKYLIEGIGYHVEPFPNAEAFLESYQKSEDTHQILLLDVRLPGMSGIDLQQHLIKKGDRIPVIMISGHADVPAAVRAMKAGACDFLAKPINAEELAPAISYALTKARTQGRRIDATVEEIQGRIARLTPRETEVLHLVVDGMSTREIAAELDISFKTIEAHRAKIMTKVQASSVAHLMRLWLSQQMVTEPRV